MAAEYGRCFRSTAIKLNGVGLVGAFYSRLVFAVSYSGDLPGKWQFFALHKKTQSLALAVDQLDFAFKFQ